MSPMLATPVTDLPTGAGWAYEFKWDGVRALLDVSAGRATLHSRNGNDVTPAYPEVAALGAQAEDVLLDGEVVAFRDGRPSFDLLATRMHVRAAAPAMRLAATTPVTFVVFDLLRYHGVDLTGRGYVERRATLDRWLAERTGWTVSRYFDDAAATEHAAREHGLEGVVAKRLASRYRPGTRGPDWVKLRFVRAGEFAVVGWEAAREAPDTLSSLLLGYTVETRLRYAGKVGSGLDAGTSAALRRRLHEQPSCPLPEPPPPSPGRALHWVTPRLVVEVAFAVWTEQGRLRHPVFRRIRDDKTIEEATGDD